MLTLGLTYREWQELMNTLTFDHPLRVEVLVMDLEDNVLADVSHLLTDGQVDGAAQDRYRSTSAKVALWDPAHELGFDTSAPQDGQLFADRMLSVTYQIRAWRLGLGWVDIPIFRGPVSSARREGPVLAVECVGKEALASKPVWDSVVYKRGTRTTSAIRDLMIRSGEDPDHLDIPSWPERLPKDLVVSKRDNLWGRATRLAFIVGGVLAYNARGLAQLRRISDNVVFTFRDEASAGGDYGPTVLTPPKAAFDTREVVNAVHVTGTPRSEGGSTPMALAALPRGHPLNSHRIGRRGSQHVKVEYIEDRDIRSGADARALAEDTLARRSREWVQVEFDSLPVPFLEAGDMCAVHTSGTVIPTFRLTSYSIPLGHGGVMTVGTRRRVHELTRRRWR